MVMHATLRGLYACGFILLGTPFTQLRRPQLRCYVDGHEGPDVVQDRKDLFDELKEVAPMLLTENDETLEVCKNSHILVSKDDKIRHGNN